MLSERQWRVRIVVLWLCFMAGCVAIVGRLYYWQIHEGAELRAEADRQYQRPMLDAQQRGKIFSADRFPLATNAVAYECIAQPHLMTDQATTFEAVWPSILAIEQRVHGDQPVDGGQLREQLLKRIQRPGAKWVVLADDLSEDEKNRIGALKLKGITFQSYAKRSYPEGTLAAHVLGFVGKNTEGLPQGYFGIEGYFDRWLEGAYELNQNAQTSPLLNAPQTTRTNDLMEWLLPKQHKAQEPLNIVLSIRRDMQHMVEQKLAEGIKTYGAVKGDIVVMDPHTGDILAMAAYPSYAPAQYRWSDTAVFKNPTIADGFEPGSIFKVITLAAGINAGLVNAETPCATCAGPRQFGTYHIRTWNEEYHPNITMKDAIAKSDNVAMVFIGDLLGDQRFVQAMQHFRIGDETHVMLQEDTATRLRQKWRPLDIATATFGQGFLTTTLQMVRAVAIIANQGKFVEPRIVLRIEQPDGTEVPLAFLRQNTEVAESEQVISAEAAQAVTQVMEYAARTGEAKWTNNATHRVAGKTGTAQVAVEGGYENADETIASYVGFAPAQDPKFVMLVKLVAPKSSQWAAETSAPLWYSIADQLYILLNIPSDRVQ
jgi:cell division protein FtsI/penicillin-binding protein 2